MSDESFNVVSRFDEAIDFGEMTDDAKLLWAETHDPKHLAFRVVDGVTERPTVWHCRRLKTSEMREVGALPTPSEKFVAAFARGFMGVTDLREGDGRTSRKRASDKPLNDRVLDEYAYGDVQEVGAAIYGRSSVGKGRPAAWPLPDTSRDAAAAVDLRRAVETKRSRSSDLNRQQAAGAQPTTALSSPAGVTSGAATATGSSEEKVPTSGT